MISHGVEISFGGGGADEKDEKKKKKRKKKDKKEQFFLYHIFVVTVQEIAWSASYGENKTQNPKQTNKRNNRHQTSS